MHGSISGQLPARSGGSSVHGIEVSVLAQWASLWHFGVDAPSHTAPFEHDARGPPGQGLEGRRAAAIEDPGVQSRARRQGRPPWIGCSP